MIGQDAKDVLPEHALDYVAGYTVGNDISSRKLQRDPTLAGPVPQYVSFTISSVIFTLGRPPTDKQFHPRRWGYSKGFDTYAPLGPVLVSTSLIPDPSALQLETVIDDELRQSCGTNDLCFNIPYLISYFSQGTTLQKGSVIMTGTPGGECQLLSPFLLQTIHRRNSTYRSPTEADSESNDIGVGSGLKPPKYLVPGTQMAVKISGIGTLRNGVEFA